jgi:hypothetical protein
LTKQHIRSTLPMCQEAEVSFFIFIAQRYYPSKIPSKVPFFIFIEQRYYRPKIPSKIQLLASKTKLISWPWGEASPRTPWKDQVVCDLTSKMANVNRRRSFSDHRNLVARENDIGRTKLLHAMTRTKLIQTISFIYLNVMRTDIEPFVPVEWSFPNVHFVQWDHSKV